jgi:hypothetical protein
MSARLRVRTLRPHESQYRRMRNFPIYVPASWPLRGQLWITVQEGRRAEWIEEAITSLKRCLEEATGSVS